MLKANTGRRLRLAALAGAGVLLAAMVAYRLSHRPPREQPPQWVESVDGIRVRPGFVVERIAGPGDVSYPMLGTLDDRGRLFITESSGKDIPGADMPKFPECRIRMMEDLDGDGFYERSKIFADHLSLPMGAVWYRGSLYVASPPDYFRFDDPDDDGVADRREVILTGWNIRNTASLHGPFLGPDGWMYLTHGRHGYKIRTKEGRLLEGLASRLWRCRPDGTGLERVCGGGFDNPVEIIFTPAGETIGTMTYFVDPQRGQRDALMHFVEGGVYPKPHPSTREFQRTGDLMPVMTKFARTAPAGLLRFRSTGLGAEYQGNLFSAQFNTHRILRHILSRQGATFRTRDEDFVISSDPDFHPTEVIEDADGSLIFFDTGAWYVDACPISRVTKPDRRGGIYRVRRTGAPRPEDPRGAGLKLETLAPAELAARLDDPRPAVSDRAADLLVQRGTESVAALAGVRERNPSPEVRAAAVFALGRIGTANAASEVRAALSDADPQVRVAAARMAGLAADRSALDRLIEITKADDPAARRQAATALGQIGDRRAVPALLAASADASDRFVEHAIIFSLIQLHDAAAVSAGLQDSHPRVRKAAMIALDQMEGSPLRREDCIASLEAADTDLQRAALWVVSHHPEWAGSVLEFLRARLRDPEFVPAEAPAVRDVVVSFCADSHVQEMVARLLGDSGLGSERRLFLLDVADRCPLKQTPAAWVRQFGRQLGDADAQVRSRTVALVHRRRIEDLDPQLRQIASNPGESAAIRIAAMGTLVTRHPRLDSASFEFLTGLLPPETEAALRLSAAQALAGAQLDDAQLLALATRHLSQADALILPTLIDAFRNARDERTGEALAAALGRPGVNLHSLGGKRIETLFRQFPEKVQASARPLLERFQAEESSRIEHLKALEPLLAAGGDVARGREIFFGKKVACSTCHTMGTEGGDVGPDLTTIGSIRSGHDLLEAIVFPSASFVPGHEVYRVRTRTDVFSGVLHEQEAEAVVLVTGPNATLRIPRDEIVSMEPSPVSLMPEGFDTTLSRQEFADLLAYLRAQE